MLVYAFAVYFAVFLIGMLANGAERAWLVDATVRRLFTVKDKDGKE